MKIRSIVTVIIIGLVSLQTVYAQSSLQKETIKVWGNCGMCKATIEKTAKAAGVKMADWNEETKELTVTFKTSKTSALKIQKAIAKKGYDTQDFTGDNKAYEALPDCCQYDRKSTVAIPAVIPNH